MRTAKEESKLTVSRFGRDQLGQPLAQKDRPLMPLLTSGDVCKRLTLQTSQDAKAQFNGGAGGNSY